MGKTEKEISRSIDEIHRVLYCLIENGILKMATNEQMLAIYNMTLIDRYDPIRMLHKIKNNLDAVSLAFKFKSTVEIFNRLMAIYKKNQRNWHTS